MAKCLFINPSYKVGYHSPTTEIIDLVFPPVGLISLAAMGELEGHQIRVLDLSFRSYDWRVIDEEIKSFSPDVVGVTGTTPLMNQIRDISVFIKTQYPHILTMAGGSHVSALPYESLKESMLDVVVIGEGEQTFLEILKGNDLKSISGIYFRDQNNQIHQNPMRPFLQDLDQLPFPAWHLFNANDYKDKISRLLTRRVPSCMVEFSRGCMYTCDFCASKLTMGHGLRKKSPERCAQEVALLYQHGWREFAITDDIFTSDKEWAKEVCRKISDLHLDVIWTCTNGIRVESADEELFRLMRKSGCYRVSFGLESGNEEVLRLFGKGGQASVEKGVEAVTMAKRAGLDVSGFFLLGLSPDTESSMQDTISYARDLPLDMLKFGIAIAFPGTKMFKEYHQKKMIKSYNWDDYNVYTDTSLFAHPNLSFDLVKKYRDIGFKKAIFFNPRFIFNRIIHGLRTMGIFWDIYYSVLLIYSTFIKKKPDQAHYYAKEKWPDFDFKNQDIHFIEYRKARGDDQAEAPSNQD